MGEKVSAHGTPQGYDDGCRGSGACDNHRTGKMTCTEAHIRYQGDWEYHQQVDAGTATDARAKFIVPKVPRLVAESRSQAATRASRAKPKVAKAPKKEPKPRPKAKHGTASGYKSFARPHDCPSEFTCNQAAALARKEYHHARKAAA